MAESLMTCTMNYPVWLQEESKKDLLVQSKLVEDAMPSMDAHIVLKKVGKVWNKTQQEKNPTEVQGVKTSQCPPKAPEDTCKPFMLLSLLRTCTNKGDLHRGREIHDAIVKRGLLKKQAILGNALVNMYSKCGALAKAEEVFTQLEVRDVVSWNSIIGGYMQHGRDEEALNCFERMQKLGYVPSAVTFACILKACANLGAVEKGREIHTTVARGCSFKNNVYIGSALINMYAKSGILEKAQEVFDELPVRNLVLWNALIAGYAQHEKDQEVLKCFEWMGSEGFSPDAFTFVCLLKACGNIGAKDKGENLHTSIVREALMEQNVLVGNALVGMYAKFGLLRKAQELFDELPLLDIISWTTLITGYVHYLRAEAAIKCFERMKFEGFFPDDITFTCLLKAYGILGALSMGQETHNDLVTEDFLENNVIVGNALVDFYANCGMVIEAQEVFDEMPARNVVTWNSLLGAHAQLGKNRSVTNLIERMLREGEEADVVTFTIVLTMCSHKGLLDEGQTHFQSMNMRTRVVPNLEHHSCMIDLFCRAGQLESVVAMIQDMPFLTNLTILYALLGACRDRGHLELGRLAFEHVERFDETEGALYVCMSNMYAAHGWHRVLNLGV